MPRHIEECQRNSAFSLNEHIGPHPIRGTLPPGHEINNFGRCFFAHHYYIFSLSAFFPGVKRKIFKRNNAFSLYDHVGSHPIKGTPAPRGDEIYNFGRCFLAHRYYIFSLFAFFPGVKKKILKRNNAFSLYDLVGSHPVRGTPAPRGHEIYNFCRGFHVHYNYIFSLSALCSWVEKKIYEEFHHF